MHIQFLGTRGGIKIRSDVHHNHTSTLIKFGRKSILIDAGTDWSSKIKTFDVDAILITHAHPDHVGALEQGAPCPVYATQAVWDAIEHWPIKEQFLVADQQEFSIGSFNITPYAVEHSLRAPATGYRISAGKHTVFHAGDLVKIYKRHAALHNVDLYIGDGANLTRPIVRIRDHYRMGHASMKQQLAWCKDERVPSAVFTHCGSQIVRSDYQHLQECLAELGEKVGVQATLAYDGMVMRI